jgi:hypothetical protein
MVIQEVRDERFESFAMFIFFFGLSPLVVGGVQVGIARFGNVT